MQRPQMAAPISDRSRTHRYEYNVTDLLTSFNEFFQVLPATTAELKEEVFRLRYEVICEELGMPGYESWRFPDGKETDEYDYRSVHCILRHLKSGQTAGALRLILPDPENHKLLFPIEKHAGHLLDLGKTNIDEWPPRQQVAEVSRFIIAKRFRSRCGDGDYAFGPVTYPKHPDSQGRRHFPNPVLGLLVSLIKLSAENKIRYWYMIMEPTLNRLLRRFSFNSAPIGPIIQYHGRRKPYLGDAAELMNRVYKNHHEIWQLLSDNGKAWPFPSYADKNQICLGEFK